MSNGYYTLIASLPHLPRFDQAEHLPINRERLLQRLKMLKPGDYELAKQAADFLAWRRQSDNRTDTEMVAIYQQGVEAVFEAPRLKPLFEIVVNQRTILSALRRKLTGVSFHPKELHSKELWGAGSLVKPIENNWDHPFFRLQGRYPWMIEAKNHLESGAWLKLEHLLFSLTWDGLEKQILKNYFCFERVIAYLLKWDILRQWLSYSPSEANIRFEKLIQESIEEYTHANHT